MIVVVEVGVALTRPPRLDRISRVVVDVPCPSWRDLPAAETDAELTALGIAAAQPDVVMPVFSRVVEVRDV